MHAHRVQLKSKLSAGFVCLTCFHKKIHFLNVKAFRRLKRGVVDTRNKQINTVQGSTWHLKWHFIVPNFVFGHGVERQMLTIWYQSPYCIFSFFFSVRATWYSDNIKVGIPDVLSQGCTLWFNLNELHTALKISSFPSTQLTQIMCAKEKRDALEFLSFKENKHKSFWLISANCSCCTRETVTSMLPAYKCSQHVKGFILVSARTVFFGTWSALSVACTSNPEQCQAL